MLNLRYPSHEVVVVDDGSTDRTFELLDAEFALEPYDAPIDPAIRVMAPILGTYRSRVDTRLIVVRKVNAQTRSDAVNAGLAHASNTLVCMTDADSIFDPDALLLVARAYLRDPERTVGIGGTIRAINGSSVTRGYLEDAKAPTTWTARIQVVEYLRSFLLGRVAWSRLKALIIVSGAFGVYRRQLLSELGGLDPEALAEDAELVVRVHKHMRDAGPGVPAGVPARPRVLDRGAELTFPIGQATEALVSRTGRGSVGPQEDVVQPELRPHRARCPALLSLVRAVRRRHRVRGRRRGPPRPRPRSGRYQNGPCSSPSWPCCTPWSSRRSPS